MTTELIPKYLDIDYLTLKTRLRELLEDDATFKDYNIEGSNISILLELIAYHGALTTFYLNKIAKNQYMDTADIYECAHMLSRLRGYNPMGYRSSSAYLIMSITASAGARAGDIINIPAWTEFKCGTLTTSDGDEIKFSTTYDITFTIPVTASFPYNVLVPVRQGEVTTYTYTGDDIVDNKIYLPFYNFDYDDNLDDQSPSVEVSVGSEIWTRIPDFYDEISGLQTLDTVYMFRYDKYEKYVIEFSSGREVPDSTDQITVKLLKTHGEDGNVAANSIDTFVSDTAVYNRTTTTSLSASSNKITIINPLAATGGSEPESITEIKESSLSALHSQYRNVTKLDYIGKLEERAEVVVANVWGEQEIAPSGSTYDYNRVHISVIPSEWGSSTIGASTSAASGAGGTDTIYAPSAYSSTFESLLSVYLEPYKMLCAYELYELPELVYFYFDIGLQIKRTYVYSSVENAVRNKLIYYFDSTNRLFNETISFIDIINYILDSTIVSSDDDFAQVKGIQNIIVRDIDVLTHTVYEPNGDGNYPQYVEASSEYTGVNKLRKISLGFNQFPMLAINHCTFNEET